MTRKYPPGSGCPPISQTFNWRDDMQIDRTHKRHQCQITETVMDVRVGKAATICLSMGLVLLFQRPAVADAVTDWNANAGKAALAACIAPIDNPLHESRMYAMMHVAI